jgi:hypothetical protein
MGRNLIKHTKSFTLFYLLIPQLAKLKMTSFLMVFPLEINGEEGQFVYVKS